MKRFFEYLDRMVEIITMVFLSIMVIVVFLQVIYRFVLHNPLQWSEELGRFLFVWISFLGAAIALQRGEHLGIDVFLRLFPKKIGKALVIISYLVILAFLVLISYKGLNVLNIIKRQRSASLRLPMTWPYAGVFVGLVLMTVNCLRVLNDLIFGNRIDELLSEEIEELEEVEIEELD